MRYARFSRALVLLAAAASTPGCKKSPVTGENAELAASASAAPERVVPTRCAEVAPNAHFIIGKPPQPHLKDADPEDEINEPFAVEVGRATALDGGFAVSALESQARSTSALLATVTADGAHGKIVSLGRVQGDVDPPRLARRGRDVFVAVSTIEPKGTKLRLGCVQDAAADAHLIWGGEIVAERGELGAYDLAVAGERGVLAFDELDKKSRRQAIRLATFDIKNPATLTVPRPISGTEFDAEMPALAPRPSGYWLAWVASVPKPASGPKAKRETAKALTAESDSDGGLPSGEDPGADSVLDLGNRFIELVALDANGSPVSPPKSVTPRDRHVMVFDLAPTADGGVILAWRDEQAAPGAENRTVHLAEVKADGNIQRSLVDDEDVGAGAPSLVADSDDLTRPSWLVLESVSDETRLSAVGTAGTLLDELNREPAVGSADVLALRDGRMLLSRARGVASELSVVACKPAKKAGP